MLVVINSSKYMPAGLISLKLKKLAKYRIYNRGLSGADHKVNTYCKNTYGHSLKETCLYLINNLKVLQTHDENKYTCIFPDKSLDKIAHIITYGNGEFLGSKILQKALEF